MVHQMLPINFNRNINKMFDFGTVRFESNNVRVTVKLSNLMRTRNSIRFDSVRKFREVLIL
jgi:hypothetical protein